MTRPMKITILDIEDFRRGTLEAPWYMNPAFIGKELHVHPKQLLKNGKMYYQLAHTVENMTLLREMYLHLSKRMMIKVQEGRLPGVFLEEAYCMPSGTTNQDFLFLLTPKEEYP